MSKRIMVIDDEEPITLFIGDFLKRYNYEVITFIDTDLALDYFKKCTTVPDLLIIDLLMPKVTGLQFIELIKKKFDIKTILVSALSKNEHITNVDAMLQKPFNLKELLNTIKEVLND